MKHATRLSALGAALKRHTGVAALGCAHVGVLLAGFGSQLVDRTDGQLFKLSHADIRFVGKHAPSESYALTAAAAEQIQPRLQQASTPLSLAAQAHAKQDSGDPTAHKRDPSSSAQAGRFGLQAFDPLAASSPLSPEMLRVKDWISDTYRVSADALEPALLAAEESAVEHGFDPMLIVAIMAVESSFNPKAVSNMGAQGLMQVIPRFHQDKIGPGRDKYALFDPVLNVRVGTLVLQEGVQRYGTLQRALQYYNGALKDPNARYTRKVMALKKRIEAVSGRGSELVQQAQHSNAG